MVAVWSSLEQGDKLHDYQHGIALSSLVLVKCFLPVSLLREYQYFCSLCIFIVVEPQEGTSLVLQDWIQCCILLHELRPEERSFAVRVNSEHHFDRRRKM
jgi:hypothetical protein